MNKVTLKLNGQVQKAIKQSLAALEDIEQIDYQVDWSNFPNSLRLNCILKNTHHSPSLKQNLGATQGTDKPAINQVNNHTLAPNNKDYSLHLKKIQQCFLKQGIKFKDFRHNVQFSLATQTT